MIVLVNATILGAALVLGCALLTGGSLSVESPAEWQVVGESILSLYVGKGRAMACGAHADRKLPSVVPLLATLANDVGSLEERIVSTEDGAITSVQAVYLPADDLADPGPASSSSHLDALFLLSRRVAEMSL